MTPSRDVPIDPSDVASLPARQDAGQPDLLTELIDLFFDDAAETVGAEIMRYLYASQNPTQNLNFPDIHHGGERRE